VHEFEHVFVPFVPHEVIHDPIEPAQHVKSSSQAPSQSSSRPLHVSVGGTHAPQVHEDEHVCVPTEPQVVVQVPEDPWQHAKPSSHVPSQSSSIPLQVSVGGTQEPHVHQFEHVIVPVVPHVVVQLSVVPLQHPNPSSQTPSQSSSSPLQVSTGGGASGGQVAELPVQYSSASQGPVEGRHTVVLERNASRGQVAEVPVQYSAISQSPAEGRQIVSEERKPSTGHSTEVPVQFSATSQGPAEERQTVSLERNPSAGHKGEDPVQYSATSQIPAEGRQIVSEERKPSTGHSAEVPVQRSAKSQGPAEGRQIVSLERNPSAGHKGEDPVQYSATSHIPIDARHS